MSTRYRDVVDALRTAYDRGAERRDREQKAPWKLAERDTFLRRLREQGCGRLLEIGAGTGQDAAFFHAQGLRVVATDLSPVMVARCRAKGLDARVMEFARLDFPPESFDAVHAMNCLLHVPNADLPAVLAAIRAVLRPGGLFFLGEYGGDGRERVFDSDVHDPPRFFSWRTDDQIQRFAAAASFDLVDFHVVELGEFRFQSLTLRRGHPPDAPEGAAPEL